MENLWNRHKYLNGAKTFKDGRQCAENESHPLCPKTSTGKQIADRLNARIQGDRKITVRDDIVPFRFVTRPSDLAL